MPTWDEQQYSKFIDQRTRPARELLSRVPLGAAERIVDLGCGPGNSTQLLAERWPNARITGVDNSADMLVKAREALPNIEWVQADLRNYRPEGPIDVLFANAVFQWLPDHRTLFPELLQWLRPGGALALQMPYNANEPTHRAMRELPGPWSAKIARARPDARVETPAFYYDLFATRASSVDIWQTRYEQVMVDADAIVEWVKGTGLRPYLEALEGPERADYLKAYRDAVDREYPVRTDGKRLFPFPRLFVVVIRS
jgi:trans-aconitate 2-methyltransferase